MRSSANPIVWGAWGLAITLITVTTRDPLYLFLTLIATTTVYLTQASRASDAATWNIVVRIGALVAVVSILFNLFTAHVGDAILFAVPASIPIVGGIVTANALAYGASTALSITTLIMAAATFGAVVDRAPLLRLVPHPISSAGVAAVIGLSFFPQMIVTFRDVREAQAARGFKMRSVRDVTPLIVPTLFLGLERAINLAESMESRAFGSESTTNSNFRWLLPLSVVAWLASVALLIGGHPLGAAASAILGATLVLYGLFGQRDSRQSFRPLRWDRSDWIILVASGASAVCFATALVAFPEWIVWSPFPRLSSPPFVPWLGLACLVLIVPALFNGGAK